MGGRSRSSLGVRILASPPHRGGGFCLVGGIGASPMTRRRGEWRRFGEGSASAGSCGRSFIGRRPDATRGREVKGEGCEIRSQRSGVGSKNTTISVAPRSPPFQGGGGPRLSVVGWFGAVRASLGDLLQGPSPKSVGGIGASPMTRRRCELRRFREGSASAGSRGRSVIGRRPDATRGREVKSEG